MFLKYHQIRHIRYEDSREVSRRNNEDFDNFIATPYTYVKGRLYLELATLVVWIVQRTNIQPNHLTLIYALSGVIGGCLLASPNTNHVYLGVAVFFFKGVFDWADGLLARIQDRLTAEGAVMDPWGAYVNSHFFVIGFGLYVYNHTLNEWYVGAVIAITVLRAVDLRAYTFTSLVTRLLNNEIWLDGKSENFENINEIPITIKRLNDSKESGVLFRLAKILLRVLDDRAHTVDLVCLVMIIELVIDNYIFSPFILALYFLKYCGIFLGTFYMVYHKKLPTSLNRRFFT